uniref:hypothetical protein n=1 Tax=Clostridium perfringens TaxID=1502 RepID=UPI0039E8C6B5
MEKVIEPILTALTLGIVGVILAIIKSVGEVNKGKKQLFEDNLKQQATQLVEKNKKLKEQLKILRGKLYEKI